MAADESVIRAFAAKVFAAISRWLARVRKAVMAPWRLFGAAPDPTGVYAETPMWRGEVDGLLTDLIPAQRGGWDEVDHDSGDFVSTNMFTQAQLAQTENLLVRIPDEVYHLVFAEITDGMNNGEQTKAIADRIDRLLDATGSERWQGRAMVIARTEVNRAHNAGSLAAGFQAEKIEGVALCKEWQAHDDPRTRPTHHAADGQTVPMAQPFQVGGALLMYPGDPAGPADEVIQCRCSIGIVDCP